MTVGAGAGLGLYGLLSLPGLFAPGQFAIADLILRLVMLAGFYWAWRSYPAYREELADTNRAGKILAWLAMLIVTVAVCLSTFLLLL
jgi:hypothetical protein